MPKRRILSAVLSSLAVWTCWIPVAAAIQAKPNNAVDTSANTSPEVPLRSREALEAYLVENAGKRTPLDELPPLARRRFLDSLVFGRNGLGGFDTGDLETELMPGEVHRLLSIFDVEAYSSSIHSRHPGGSIQRAPGRKGIPGNIESGFDRLYTMSRADKTRQAELPFRFEATFGDLFQDPGKLSSLDDRELIYLLRSVALAWPVASDPTSIERLSAVVGEMERRGIAQTPDVRKVHDALLLSRNFEQARQYAAARPIADLPPLPRLIDTLGTATSSPSVWRMDADGATLTRTLVDLAPVQILITAGCHFSEDAAEDISADAVLGPVFAEHATWLVLPPGREDLDAVRAWNRHFPAAPATLLYDRDEWELLPSGWAMPTFFVIRDGKVMDRIVGWPRNPTENRQPLIDALMRAGLINEASVDKH